MPSIPTLVPLDFGPGLGLITLDRWPLDFAPRVSITIPGIGVSRNRWWLISSSRRSSVVTFPTTFLASIKQALYTAPIAPITPTVTGGYWNRITRPGTPYPNVTFLLEADRNEGAGGPTYLQAGRVTFRVFAQDAIVAREIADSIANQYPIGLNDAPLLWSNSQASGRVIYFRTNNPTSDEPTRPGPGGSLVYVARRVFRYRLQSAYIPGFTPLVPVCN